MLEPERKLWQAHTIAGAILEKMGHFLSGEAHGLTSPPASSALAVLSVSDNKKFKYRRENFSLYILAIGGRHIIGYDIIIALYSLKLGLHCRLFRPF